ncbi:MAG: alpha-glucan family phosphorylase [Thermoflexales bacterium]|nr:alpha-glucan family phosphorylase [Thermoflexales bacterium]
MTDFHTTVPTFSLPKPIARLGDLAYNLWWSWHPEALRLYRFIDPVLWERVSHNPVKLLQQAARKNLNAVAQDSSYLDQYKQVIAAFDAYLNADTTWTRSQFPDLLERSIAYFSTEFGLHEALPMYAGGLGVLSGDHLKEASDLGLPLVAVGFLYRQGYFRQRIAEDGWQEAINENLNLAESAILPVMDEGNRPLTVPVEMPDRVVYCRVWRVQVGRVPLFMIDTDLDPNSAADRELTTRLYYSDLERRLQQEMLLGIGGVRALRALGYQPAVFHMNEGHSAFLSLERIREFVAAGDTFDQAVARIRDCSVFTTHTPVPAGHDMFPTWMMEKYFANYWPQLGLDRNAFMALAYQREAWGEVFSMSLLAIRCSSRINGVSELHGEVSRRMFAHLWPERAVDKVPIGSITNGVHTNTWLARRLGDLYTRYLGADWRSRIDDRAMWDKIRDVPDTELWAVRRHVKRQLVAFARERARAMWSRGNAAPVQIVASGVLLDPYALTIGFARRFATYKRAALMLRDVKRLLRLVNDPARPVQFIFAGKAHPADDPGKRVIQDLYRFIKESSLNGRLVFLEDYDMNVARHLVQGVDVWMNTPRRPLEASGTSGEKAGLNGVLNFSILDGWWREGYNGENGWAIGSDADYGDPEAQDAADAESLFDTLEQSIVPLYYDVDSRTGVPTGWIRMVKESIRTLGPMFSTARMLKEYATDLYVPASLNQPIED